jgi:hypothetical protein
MYSKKMKVVDDSKNAELETLKRLLRETEERHRESEIRRRQAEKREVALQNRLAEVGDDTTFEGFLDSRLPDMRDLAVQRYSSTKAVASFIPKEVVHWSLKGLVANFRKDLSPELMSKPAKKMVRPGIGGVFCAGEESQLVSHFAEAACKALDLLCSLDGIEILTQAAGIDDFSSFGKGPKPDLICSHEGRPLLCGDGKKGNMTSKGSDLVARYASEKTVQNLIYQITGYQVTYLTEFGFITNYFHTWITRLDPDGVLHISEAFHHVNCGHESTLNALFYAVNVALRSKASGGWICPALDTVTVETSITEDNGSKEESAGDNATNLSQGNDDGDTRSTDLSRSQGSLTSQGRKITLKRILQRHPDRITYMAALQDCGRAIREDDNLSVIVKCFSDRDARDLEVLCYRKLLPLQGKHVPKILSCGTLNDEETSRRYALVLQHVGEDIEGQESRLPPHAWKQFREVVVRMHELGVVYGDLESRNMAYDESHGCVFLYDFSSALTLERLGSKAFAKACTSELEHFDSHVSSIITARAEQHNE